MLLMLWTIAARAGGRPPAPAPAKCLGHFLSQADTDTPPPTGWRGYDVLTYQLELKLDPVRAHVAGQVAMDLRAVDPSLDLVQLDLVPELTVTSILQETTPLSFTHDGDALWVQLARPLTIGQETRLVIQYEGYPPRHGHFQAGLMFRYHNAGTPDDPTDDKPVVANMSQPWSAHSWWPCKDDPHDKALVRLAATVPDTLRVVSNGFLFETTVPAAGWRRYAWREAYPLPTYLVSVAASDYVTWQETCEPAQGPPVNLEYHVFPADRPKAEIDFEPTCDMLDFMTTLAGPYPYAGEKYAQVEIKWIGAMEHATATSVSQIFLTGDRRHETLIIHELAHQWFGDSLTPRVWADIWLNEGFARYGEALWLEHAYGRQTYVDYMAAIGTERHPDYFAGDGLLSDPDPILPNLLVYDKGAWLLHSLRLWLGDDDFFTLLRDYATDPNLVHGQVTTADFTRAAELAGGQMLTDFFGPWLDTDTVPRLSSRLDILPCAEGRTEVVVTLQQHQTPRFQVAVPVDIHVGNQVLTRVARLEKAQTAFHWSVPCGVDSVCIDPDSLVLARRHLSPPAALTVRGPVPNPVGSAGCDFEIYLINDGRVDVGLFDARGRRLSGFELGNLTATGPAEDPLTAPHRWHWEPALMDQAPAAGIYWLEFRTAHHRSVRKLAYLP